MKKYIYLLCFLFVFSCNQEDFLVQDVFPFDIILSAASSDPYVLEKTSLTISISPELKIENTSYIVQPVITKGSANIYHNDEKLDPGSSFTINTLDYVFAIEPLSVDPIEIALTVVHSKDKEIFKEERITINPSYRPLGATLIENDDEYPLNRYTPLDLSISTSAASSSFELNYQVEGGEGKLYRLENTEYIGIPTGENITLNGGVHNLFYRPENVASGSHIISGAIMGADGNSIPLRLELSVVNLKWSLQASALTTAPKKNQPYDLTIIISSEDENIDQEVKFEINGGLLDLNSPNGDPVDFGTWKPIDEGTHKFKFTGKEVAELVLSIEVRDQNNYIQAKEITLDVNTIPFNFLGFPAQNDVIFNTPVQINLDLSSEFDVSEISYTYGLKEGNGVLKDSLMNVIAPADRKSIELGSTTFEYTPSSIGAHKLEFTALLDGLEKTILITVNVVESNFEFTATSALANTFVKDSVIQNFTFSGFEGLDYNLKFASTVNGRLQYRDTIYTAGESIKINQDDVDNASWSGKYIGDLAGLHTVIYNLRDSNGVEKEASTEITFGSVDFDFTASSENIIEINNPLDIVLTSTSIQSINAIDYSYVVSSGSGSVLDGSAILSPNTLYSLPLGSKTIRYTPSSIGTHTLVLTGTFGGINKVTTLNFNVVGKIVPFEGTITPSTASANSNSPISQTIKLVDANALNSFVLNFTTTGTGSVTYNGDDYASGSSIPILSPHISNSSIPFTYTGASTGDHAIIYTLSDGSTTINLNSTLNFKPVFKASIQSSTSSNTVGVPINQTVTLVDADTSKAFVLNFTTTGTGSVTYNGVSYESGTSIAISGSHINSASFPIAYYGSTPGAHLISYSISDGETSSSFNSTLVFGSSLSAVLNSTITKQFNGSSISQTINLMNVDLTKTYLLKFTTTGTGSITYNSNVYNSGTPIAVLGSHINSGLIPIQYNGNSIGVHAVEYTLYEGSTSVTLSSELTFEKVFSVSISPNTASEVSGSSISQTLNINDADTSKAFVLNFTTTGTGSVTYNGISYEPGTSISISGSHINSGSIPIMYFGNSTGDHTVEYTLEDGLIAKKASATLKFNPRFSASINSVKNEEVVQTPINQTITLLNADTSNSFVLNFTTTGTGSVTYNGSTYAPGSSISVLSSDIISGSFSVAYNASSPANHAITYTLNDGVNTFTLNENLNFISLFSVDFPSQANYSITQGVSITFSLNVVGALSWSSNVVTAFDTTSAIFTSVGNDIIYYPVTGGNSVFEIEVTNNDTGAVKRSINYVIESDDSFTAILEANNELALSDDVRIGTITPAIPSRINLGNLSINGPSNSQYEAKLVIESGTPFVGIDNRDFNSAIAKEIYYDVNFENEIAFKAQNPYPFSKSQYNFHFDIKNKVSGEVVSTNTVSTTDYGWRDSSQSSFAIPSAGGSLLNYGNLPLVVAGNTQYNVANANVNDDVEITLSGINATHISAPDDYVDHFQSCYNLYYLGNLIYPSELVKLVGTLGQKVIVVPLNSSCNLPSYLRYFKFETGIPTSYGQTVTELQSIKASVSSVPTVN